MSTDADTYLCANHKDVVGQCRVQGPRGHGCYLAIDIQESHGMLAGLGILLMWTMDQNFAGAGGYGEGWLLAVIYRVNVPGCDDTCVGNKYVY